MAVNIAKPLDEDLRTFSLAPDFNVQAVDGAIAAQYNAQQPTTPANVFQTVDHEPAAGELGIALSKLCGKFRGRGLNMIFRPRNSPDSKEPGDDPFRPGGDFRKNNLLEYDLTEEKLVFLGGDILKDVPNRGFATQPHVNLRGTPYLQQITNVLNPVSVQPDSSLKTDIHFEPGLFMRTPATKAPELPATISRMASIPHGTTINAQGLDPTSEIKGAPVIPIRTDTEKKVPTDSEEYLKPITPFLIATDPKDPKNLVPFPNMKYNTRSDFRIPKEFPAGAFITPEIFEEPNHLLQQNNEKKKIVSHVTFKLSTAPWEAFKQDTTSQSIPEHHRGGGTNNIAFLAEKELPLDLGKIKLEDGTEVPRDKDDENQPEVNTKTFIPIKPRIPDGKPSSANANAVKMESTFWISKIQHKITIPPWKKGLTYPICKPEENTDPKVQRPRAFRVKPNRTVKEPTEVAVFSTQIQYSQLVLLDFGIVSWPHISVATLIPDDKEECDLLVIDVDVDEGIKLLKA
jgi:hypothetical protein